MTNTSIRRRTFLKLTASSFFAINLSSCTHKKFYNPDEDIILSGGSYLNSNKTQFALIAINLTQQAKRVIETTFLPHDTLINPKNKHRILCFEKNGTNGCEIDLQKESVIRTFKSTEDKRFSGHASYSDDGKNVYCIENNIDANPSKQFGYVIVRDSETLSILKQTTTHGLSAHDCQLLEDQVFVVSNTGQSQSNNIRPGIIYIDLKTDKVLNNLHATGDKNNDDINNGHFKVSVDKDVVIASAPTSHNKEKQSGGVSIKKHGGSLITMNKPKPVIERMTGEALSIEISQRMKVAAITHPEANLLTFWSLKNNQIIKAYGMEKPRGISQTFNGENFIISYGDKAAMAQITIKDLTPVPDSIVQPTFTTGEHIMNWSLTLRKIMPTNLY